MSGAALGLLSAQARAGSEAARMYDASVHIFYTRTNYCD